MSSLPGFTELLNSDVFIFETPNVNSMHVHDTAVTG